MALSYLHAKKAKISVGSTHAPARGVPSPRLGSPDLVKVGQVADMLTRPAGAAGASWGGRGPPLVLRQDLRLHAGGHTFCQP